MASDSLWMVPIQYDGCRRNSRPGMEDIVGYLNEVSRGCDGGLKLLQGRKTLILYERLGRVC